MALRILTEERVKVEVPKKKFNYSDWYELNKDRLSEKRARRYREDTTYREKALERSRKQREVKKEPVVDGFTISFNEMARQLGLTIWVLREWRKKSYFPEPHHREGRLWFNAHQVSLLQKLQGFFDEQGNRMVESKREALEDIVGWVYSNWQ